jgi:cell fate regulator YaaT (PSP1 superfamily)
MKIETKFNPSNEVWVIYKSKAKKCEVHSIKVYINLDKVETIYFLNVGTKDNFKCEAFLASCLFKTRKELIDNL